ncbi:MAG: ABC transporter permease [Chloroflexi bacterium]|nr:ABC transporter permease [Chloroflexota bacterium]
MFRTRIQKILRDISSRKGRTVLVALSILIGVFGVTTMVSMGDLLVTQLNEDLDEDEIAMTHVYVSAVGRPMTLEENQAFIDRLSALPGVIQVEGQAIYPMDWRLPDGESFERGTVIAFSEDFPAVQLEPVSRIVEGRFPVGVAEGGQYEIAVEKRFANEYGVGVGDRLVFRGKEEVEWQIVGVVFQPYRTVSSQVTDVADPASPPETNMYATYEDAQAIVGFSGLSSFYARYTDYETARAGLTDFIGVITNETPYIVAFNLMDNPADNNLVRGMDQIANALDVLGVVSLVVSAFLLVNVINTIVVEQRRQIGVMKSLGGTRLDIVLIYTGMALAYGVIGTLVGVILAIPVAGWMAREIAPLTGTYIEDIEISTSGIITGIVLGLLVPVLAALIPVFNGTRVTILEAITDIGIAANWGNSRLSRAVGALPLPVNVRQALSNIVQKRGRLVLTGLALTLAFAAYMGVTAVFTSLNTTIGEMFDTFDYEIQMTTQEVEDYDAVRQLILNNVDSVARVAPSYDVSIELEGYVAPDTPYSGGPGQIAAIGIDPSSDFINFRLISGTGWENDPDREGVILNRSLAEKIDKSVGDEVTVRAGGKSYQYEVLGIEEWPFDMIFFDWAELATISGYLNEVEEPNPDGLLIDLEGEQDADAVADVIEQIKQLAAVHDIPAVYINQPQNEDDITQLATSFGMMFNMTSLVMAAVGAIGLLAALSMAVFERQKEIGVMRSLGAGSTTIVGHFLLEGVLVGIIAWVVALPLSLWLGNQITAVIEMDEIISFNYPPLVALQGLAGVAIIAAGASFWPALSAARKTVSDILRYQ